MVVEARARAPLKTQSVLQRIRHARARLGRSGRSRRTTHPSWASSLREELLRKVNECRAYLERYQKAAAEGDGLEERDPITELRAIAKLYLPELAAQTKAFSDMHELKVHEGLLHRHKLSRLSTEEKQKELKMDYGWQVAKSKKSGEADALIEAARKLLEDTMGPQA